MRNLSHCLHQPFCCRSACSSIHEVDFSPLCCDTFRPGLGGTGRLSRSAGAPGSFPESSAGTGAGQHRYGAGRGAERVRNGQYPYVQASEAGLTRYAQPAKLPGFGNWQADGSIQVTGRLKAYNGLLEMDPIASFYKLAGCQRRHSRALRPRCQTAQGMPRRRGVDDPPQPRAEQPDSGHHLLRGSGLTQRGGHRDGYARAVHSGRRPADAGRG